MKIRYATLHLCFVEEQGTTLFSVLEVSHEYAYNYSIYFELKEIYITRIQQIRNPEYEWRKKLFVSHGGWANIMGWTCK